MRRLFPIITLIFLFSCQSNPYKGSWMMQAHDAINEGEQPGLEKDDFPFTTLAITDLAILIDSKEVEYQWALDKDKLFLTIDGQEHEFSLGKPLEKDGETYLMMTSSTFTPKDFSSYYLKKIK